jgi:hypothetical protein
VVLERFQFHHAKAKKIHVYFVPGVDERTGRKIYFYAIASALLHEEMLCCLKLGDIPHFAVVVEKGEGEPTAGVKTRIRDYYGFDHDSYAAGGNASA